jgi:hypothetical protein
MQMLPATVAFAVQNPNSHVGGRSSAWDFGLLSFSVVLMVLSLLLLQEANKTTKWLFPEIPNPDSGEGWSYFLLLVMPSLWLIWMALSERDGAGFWAALLNDFLYHAKQAAVGFVIAGIVPLVLAVFKLVSIAAAGRPSADYPMGPRRPRMVPIVQGLFVLANATASVLTLLKAIA